MSMFCIREIPGNFFSTWSVVVEERNLLEGLGEEEARILVGVLEYAMLKVPTGSGRPRDPRSMV